MRRDRQGNAIQVGQWIGAPTTLALSTSTNRVALTAGKTYRLWASVDCFVQFGGVTVEATSSSNPLTAKASELACIDSNSTITHIAGIVSSGTGTLFISEIDADTTNP